MLQFNNRLRYLKNISFRGNINVCAPQGSISFLSSSCIMNVGWKGKNIRIIVGIFSSSLGKKSK